MRDIRGDLQDRANLLEEQINAHQAQYDTLIEQFQREYDARLEDLKAELEAVNRLMELELRRLGSRQPAQAPAQPHAQQAQSAQHHQQPHPQAQHHPQQVHPQQVHAQQPQQVHPQQGHAQQGHAQQPQQVHPQQPHPQQAHPQQVHHQQPQQPQPQQPLADFLVRTLGEVGPLSREDLRRIALQEGYFADGESAERGVTATLLNVAKAGLVRQLPNGNFAPATVLDTIRLRRAI